MSKVRITLDQKEQEALLSILDALLKSYGTQALDLAAHFRNKLAVAQQKLPK